MRPARRPGSPPEQGKIPCAQRKCREFLDFRPNRRKNHTEIHRLARYSLRRRAGNFFAQSRELAGNFLRGAGNFLRGAGFSESQHLARPATSGISKDRAVGSVGTRLRKTQPPYPPPFYGVCHRPSRCERPIARITRSMAKPWSKSMVSDGLPAMRFRSSCASTILRSLNPNWWPAAGMKCS